MKNPTPTHGLIKLDRVDIERIGGMACTATAIAAQHIIKQRPSLAVTGLTTAKLKIEDDQAANIEAAIQEAILDAIVSYLERHPGE